MSSFEPSRIPACDAPVCEERSVSHSNSLCVPDSTQRAIAGAWPSRIARFSTGSARPSISRNTIPGVSVTSRSPERRATRCTTRREYASSSSIPSTAPSAADTADATNATPRADHAESTCRPPVRRSAAISIRTSSNRTRANPKSKVKGRRTAATMGGSTAFSRAMTAATANAPRQSETDAPGTSAAAAASAAAPAIHVTSRWPTRKLGRAGALAFETTRAWGSFRFFCCVACC